MKNILIGAVVVIIIIGLGFWFFSLSKDKQVIVNEPQVEAEDTAVVAEDTTQIVEEEIMEEKPYTVIGSSVEGRELQAYRLGNGEKKLVLVGGIHGGYEWNSTLLTYEFIDYFTEDPDRIPENFEIIVIPTANPDGLHKVVGTSERFVASDAPQFDFATDVKLTDTVVQGRFNANGVDLNRNFDCKWKSEAVWRNNPVKAGTEPFSEPEAAALFDFFMAEKPDAVIFYHSASNGVYTSFCEGDPLPKTVEILKAYTDASEYPRYDDFPFYEITGDAADWLSTIGVPAITVELRTHSTLEIAENLAGIQALFNLY